MRVLKLSVKEMVMRIVALILFLMLTSPAWATTYYVATTGNDGASGTISAPWRTIQKAANTVVAGDTVNVRGGTYHEYWSSSTNGTAANPITFQSYPGETAIISGSSVTAPSNGRFLVRINGDYTTVRNFEITACAWDCVIFYQNADHGTAEGNTIHDGYRAGIVFYSNTFGTANNNLIYNQYDFASGGGNADCINISTSGGSHTWTNNVVHDCSDDGLDAWASTGNTITGNISYHNGYIPGTATPSGNGTGYKMGSGSGVANNLVADNVAWNNRDRGFIDNGSTGNRFYNNTAINNGSQNFWMLSPTSILANNISYGSLGSIVSGTSQTTNSWQLGITNPSFVQITDPTISTFARLQAGSSAINVGTTITGSSHVCNGVCDLGAYESGTTETIPPARPTGLLVN